MKRAVLVLLTALSACSSSDDAERTSYETKVTTGMHQTLLVDITELRNASVALQDAAPLTQGRGWDATEDAAAIENMKKAWLRARGAYERTEGALAPLFPDIDGAIDARYEDFLEELAPAGDQDLFDGQGVTGMHAIERILFAPEIPAEVTEVEQTLPGYAPAAWPATEAEAKKFKEELCAALVKDTETLLDQWAPQHIDVGGAYQGLIGLMNEQREKVVKAASSEEESRYARRTLADLRDNLAGTRKVYSLFKPWLATKEKGESIDADVEAGFAALDAAYSANGGDAIPTPPASWSSEQPSATDLQTPFGQLYTAVFTAVDPKEPTSVVGSMDRAASALGLPGHEEE
ncbi:MAG: EfeM/EfeO family lipoprotein [Polyangiaceae bacterium]|nr:EfeM/EfeO family lipoprotein [Polyangiaceae bacterium]